MDDLFLMLIVYTVHIRLPFDLLNDDPVLHIGLGCDPWILLQCDGREKNAVCKAKENIAGIRGSPCSPPSP